MADLSRKRARKSKLGIRQCEDENMQVQLTQPPIQFDIKVEVESCDEDITTFNVPTSSDADNTDIKSETLNENDLFEVEENDINQLALSLSGANQNIDSFADDNNDLDLLAAKLLDNSNASSKRKRVPNIKKEYVYSIDDVDDEEHDVSALATMLGQTSKKKKKHNDNEASTAITDTKSTIGSSKDTIKSPDIPNSVELHIKKKTELWKLLDVTNDDEDSLDADNVEEPDLSIDENNIVVDDEINVSSKKKSAKRTIHPNPQWQILQQLKIDEGIILEELEKLSKTTTEKVDKILEVEMRNVWGRVRFLPHVLSEPEKKLHAALTEWRQWSSASKSKEPPAMYKCYVCSKAWWYYYPFSEHMKGHNEIDLKIRTEVRGQECSIVAFYYFVGPKFFDMDENCWRCGNDVAFHSYTPSNSNRLRKIYMCDSCKENFGTCRHLRDHYGKCSKSLFKAAEKSNVVVIKLLTCDICAYKVLDTGSDKIMDEHMKTYHDVRSDVPILNGARDCAHCNRPVPVHYFHMCPNRNRNHECEYCNKRYPSQMALDAHLKFTRDNVDCRICGITLEKKCMEVKHMVEHSQHYGLMYKCILCPENILLMDLTSMKKHKVIWHKQKYDRRRNYFETIIVPKEFVKKQGVEKLDIVTSVKNVAYLKSIHDGTLKFVNINYGTDFNEQHEVTNADDDTDEVLIVDDSSQNIPVIEIGDDDDDVGDKVDDKVDDGIKDVKDSEIDEDINMIDKEIGVMKIKLENTEDESYEDILSQVFHKKIKREKDEEEEESSFEEKEVKKEDLDIKTENDAEVTVNDKKQKVPKAYVKKRGASKEMFECPKCPYKAILLKLKIHMATHEIKAEKTTTKKKKDEPLKCSKCKQRYGTLMEYCSHLTVHGYRELSCPECMITFESFTVLEKHIKVRARNLLLRMHFTARKETGGRPHVIVKHQCRKCKQEVLLKDMLAHWESHLNIQELNRLEVHSVAYDEQLVEESDDSGSDQRKEVTKPLTPEALKDVITAILAPKGSKVCVVCERLFDRPNDVKRHLVEHLLHDAYLNKYKYKSLRCQICHSTFAKCDEYKLHMRTHGGLPVYQCAECGKTFSDSSNNTKHKKIHAGDHHACAVCGKKFLSREAVNRHMEIHTTAPICCPLCPAIFHTETLYNKHKRAYHDKTTHKYRCVTCRKRFRSVRELWDHCWLQHHERKRRVDCALCGQAYRKVIELKQHMKDMHDLDPRKVMSFIEMKPPPSNAISVICPVCGCNYPSKEIYALHLCDGGGVRQRRKLTRPQKKVDSPIEEAQNATEFVKVEILDE